MLPGEIALRNNQYYYYYYYTVVILPSPAVMVRISFEVGWMTMRCVHVCVFAKYYYIIPKCIITMCIMCLALILSYDSTA